jgi:hypothetical protein
MSELGLSSRKYFSMFFTNLILPNVKYELRSLGKKRIIRHKDFAFSMVTLNPFNENHFVDMDNAKKPGLEESDGIRGGNHQLYLHNERRNEPLQHAERLL